MPSDDIGVTFSRDEFVLLLDVVGATLERLTAIEGSLDDDTKQFVESALELEQRLLEAAVASGARLASGAPLAEKDTLSGQWMPHPEVGSQFTAHEIVEMRDEDFFWEELALRLAEQTVIRRIGLAAWDNLGELERRNLMDPEFEATGEHLREHGIERMFFVDRDPHG